MHLKGKRQFNGNDSISHQLKEGGTFGLFFPEPLDEGEEHALHFFYFGAHLGMRSRLSTKSILRRSRRICDAGLRACLMRSFALLRINSVAKQ